MPRDTARSDGCVPLPCVCLSLEQPHHLPRAGNPEPTTELASFLRLVGSLRPKICAMHVCWLAVLSVGMVKSVWALCVGVCCAAATLPLLLLAPSTCVCLSQQWDNLRLVCMLLAMPDQVASAGCTVCRSAVMGPLQQRPAAPQQWPLAAGVHRPPSSRCAGLVGRRARVGRGAELD